MSRWFERKFAFDFPVELYPNILARLRGTPARLEELAASVPAAVLVAKPDGKWSAQENAGHLLDLEPLWAGRVSDFLSGRRVLTPADLANKKTNEAHHNDSPIPDILTKFRSARKAFLDQLESLDGSDFSRQSSHPRLNTPMRLVDHVFFVAEHDDHHLARIWQLIRL
ncbi:MAG TPA: DinB family protein [Terriglobales bacterium]|nr:DinB family protein [Terriglobales bacterium]